MRFATIPIATGTHLHYAEHGDPRGEPILFLHGWPDSWFSFSRVIPLLPDRLRAFAPDQRGFGDSGRPESGYAIADMSADATAFLDAVGITRATLVGHSYGSFVARHVAIAHPERVSGLVLIGTGFSPSNPVTRDLQKSLRDLPTPIPVEFARDFQAGTAYQPLPADFFERIIAETLKLPPRLWPLMIDHMLEYDDTRQLAQIEAPTQLLWGERDALFSRADQDQATATLSRAKLTIYRETGHCPNWERPELVAADIVRLLERT